MNEKTILNKIKKEFPKLKWKTYRSVNQGWDHDVIILDEKIVLRAPREKSYKEIFANEIQLLNHLRKKINTEIPNYKFVSKDKSIAGYECLKGKELTYSRFRHLSKSDKQRLAIQFASFITKLHKTPKAIVKKYKIKNRNQHQLNKDLILDLRKIVYPKLRKADIKAIEAYFDELRESFNHKYDNVLTHNDLTSEHILWDIVKRQLKIIDFSDQEYTDPAVDFVGIVEYGLHFTNQVFDLYDRKKNKEIIERAQLYYKRMPLWFMKDALLDNPWCTFKKGYTMFRKRFKNTI